MENNEQKGMTAPAQPAEAEGKKGAAGTAGYSGKFKDVRSLESAYNALQAEFTKKCQRLSALEGELFGKDNREKKSSSAPEEKQGEPEGREVETAVTAFLAKRGGCEDILPLLGEKLSGKERVTDRDVEAAYAAALEDARKADKEAFVSREKEIREDAVKEYVTAIARAQGNVPVLTDVGQVTIAPPVKPKNIEDAGKLAEKMFRQTKID